MKIKLSTKIYPLEAIINACYEYLDEAYFFLDGDPDKEVEVNLKLKASASKSKLSEKKLADELVNKALYYALRSKISKNNRKITEAIINRAIYSSVMPYLDSEYAIKNKSHNKNNELKFFEDPLGIAMPWEEKFGKKKNANGG